VVEIPVGDEPGVGEEVEFVEAESPVGDESGADAQVFDNWANHPMQSESLVQTEFHPLVAYHVPMAHFHAVDLQIHPGASRTRDWDQMIRLP